MQADFPRCTRPIHAALLAVVISACSGSPQTGKAPVHPASASAPPETAGAILAGSTAAAEPPAPSTREIDGYFTDAATRSSLRFWKGPNDQKGFERWTRFTVEVEGVPQYSRAVSTLRLAGVCRSGKGLDQMLFSFYPERRGGGALGVLRYDTEGRRFMLGYAPRELRFDCAGGRELLPEGTPALPCTCPWRDGPDDRPGAAATANAREIRILPEEPGGPAFTRDEAASGGDAPAQAAPPGGE